MTDCAAGSEQDENVRAAELQVFSTSGGAAVAAPNLEVTSLSSQRVSGRDYSSTATVANSGDEAAGASQTRFALDGTTELCVVSTPALDAGASTTVTCGWSSRGISKGDHTVAATADSGGVVEESDETDNSRSATVNVR